MREKKGGIYRIRNLVNGKVYVGQAIDINKRWIDHKSFLKNNKHSNIYLQASWNKYGEENLIFEIIEEIDNPTKELLCEREQYWNDFYDSSNRENGYNIRKIVESNLGITFSEEIREKNRIANSGKNNAMYGKRGKDNPNFGKHHTPDTIEKLRIINSGKNNPMYGRKGEDNPKSKLNWEKVYEIREKYKTLNYKLRELAKEYDIAISTVGCIIQNKIWEEENNFNVNIKWIRAKEIREKWNSGNYKQKELAKEYNVSLSIIRHIIYNENWKEENNIEYKNNYKETLLIRAKEIREKYKSGNYKQKELAKEYGVSIYTIYRIVNNKIYKEENNIEDKNT